MQSQLGEALYNFELCASCCLSWIVTPCVTQALINSDLDYCNLLNMELPLKSIWKLELVRWPRQFWMSLE